jgi:GxxExxY protein
VTENAVAKEIVDAGYRIHTVLGPGLLESVYEAVLTAELRKRGSKAVTQQPFITHSLTVAPHWRPRIMRVGGEGHR